MTEELETSQEDISLKTSEKPYYFKKGNPGGPGRPKGSISIKDLVRKHLEDNPNDLEEYVKHFIKKNRELSWQMLEGRPPQDITSGGEKINPMPILGGITKTDEVPTDTSIKEDSSS